MRLSDAASRTGRQGHQPRRSWWVARDPIPEVARDGRNLRLKLLNGLKVPLARRAVIRLKGFGLAPTAARPTQSEPCPITKDSTRRRLAAQKRRLLANPKSS